MLPDRNYKKAISFWLHKIFQSLKFKIIIYFKYNNIKRNFNLDIYKN